MRGEPSGGAWLAEEWTAIFERLLQSEGGEPMRLRCSPSPEDAILEAEVRRTAAIEGAFLWFRQAFAIPGEPALWVGAPRSIWVQFAESMRPGIPEAEAREVFLELLRQSGNELSRTAGEKYGFDAALSAGAEQPEAPADAELYRVDAEPGISLPPVLVAFTGALQVEAAVGALQPGRGTEESGQLGYPGKFKTFDLLLGVELPVSVSFGRIQLPLKDVLKLTAGSIVELNRTVDEPVEVIVNNCVVARGEVVVVEGNYGVRIHQIMSREQRLESLP